MCANENMCTSPVSVESVADGLRVDFGHVEERDVGVIADHGQFEGRLHARLVEARERRPGVHWLKLSRRQPPGQENTRHTLILQDCSGRINFVSQVSG